MAGGVYSRGGGAVHGGGGAWQGMGVHGRGACMVGGMCGMHSRGACMVGSVHGRVCVWWGACMAGGHVWWGVCMVGVQGRGCAWRGGVHDWGMCGGGHAW